MTKIFTLILSLSALALASCSLPSVQAYVEAGKVLAKNEATVDLENLEYFRCRGVFIGEAIDRFGQTPAKWQAYQTDCLKYWQAEGINPGTAPTQPK